MHRNYSENVSNKLDISKLVEYGEQDWYDIKPLGNGWYSTPTSYFDKWDIFICDKFPGRIFQVEDRVANRFRIFTNVKLEGKIRYYSNKLPNK